MNSAENVSNEELGRFIRRASLKRFSFAQEAYRIAIALQALRSPPTEDGDRVEAQLNELDEIADGAWGDNPMVRGKARDEAARLRAEEVRPDQAEGIPPEVARQIENAKPAIDAAERFIASVIEAEGSDWYRENDEGGLLLCHESGAYFDVFAAMRSTLAASPRPETVVSDAMVERAAREIAGADYDALVFSSWTRESHVKAEWRKHITAAKRSLTAALSPQEGE